MNYYGFHIFNQRFPIHIIRDLYIASNQFISRIKDYYGYMQATRNMLERFGTATSEEIALTDSVCIVCREEMIIKAPILGAQIGNDKLLVIKKLPCTVLTLRRRPFVSF